MWSVDSGVKKNIDREDTMQCKKAEFENILSIVYVKGWLT